MPAYRIDISDNPDIRWTVILEGIAYDVRIQWSDRDEAWTLYLGLQNQPFKFKTKVATGRDVLKTFRGYDECPKGVIIFVDKRKQWGRMQRDAFSSGRYVCYYVTSDSAEQIESFVVNTADAEYPVTVAGDARFHT